MKELLLTDSEAQKLIKILKSVASKHNRTLTEKTLEQLTSLVLEINALF